MRQISSYFSQTLPYRSYMNTSIIDINLSALEIILKNKDTLISMAIKNFELKRSELFMKLKSADNESEELVVITKELEQAKMVVEQPFVQEYINLGLIKDVNAAIEHLKVSMATRAEEEERLQILGAYRTICGKSREEAKEHLSKMLAMNIAEYTEELQIVIMNAWSWKFYYSILLQARREIASQMLKEEITSTTFTEEVEGNSKAKNKQLDSSQLVLTITLLNEVYKINKSQDMVNLIDFICALTGRDRSNIRKFVEKVGKNRFILHDSNKKNLSDLMAVRSLFEKLEQKQILKLIDGIIEEANNLEFR